MIRTEIIKEMYAISLKLEELIKEKEKLASNFSDLSGLDSKKLHALYKIIKQLDSLSVQRDKLIESLAKKSKEVAFIHELLRNSELIEDIQSDYKNDNLIEFIRKVGFITEEQFSKLTDKDKSYIQHLVKNGEIERIRISGKDNYLYAKDIDGNE